jgi:hypothetical protein
VQITDGGTGVSDTIAVKGANPASGVPGTELDTSSGTSMNSVQYNVRSSAGFAINDIVVSTLACAMTSVTSVSRDEPGVYLRQRTGHFERGGLPRLLRSAGEFFNRQYGIAASGLTVADYPAFTTNTLVDNIVFLKAQYGLASTISGSPATVARWVSGATTLNGSTCLGNSVHPACVVAVRVGVVARSASAGPQTVDQPNPLPVLPQILVPVRNARSAAAVTFSIPAGGTTVRYRAYSTIIPLKNVIWGR